MAPNHYYSTVKNNNKKFQGLDDLITISSLSLLAQLGLVSLIPNPIKATANISIFI